MDINLELASKENLIYLSIALFLVLGVVAYVKGKVGVFFVSIVALLMWSLSAMMNVWTGYEIGGVMSLYGSLFGGAFMLVTEFIVPVSLVYKSKTGNSLPFVVTASVFMAVALSVFSFWNGTAMSMNTHLAEMMKSRDDTKVKAVKLETADIQASQYTITATKSVEPLQNRVDTLSNALAHNFKGKSVYRGGKKLTVIQATNNCSSGIYRTSSKLHKTDCDTINRLNAQISRTLLSNKNVTTNVTKMSEINGEKADLLEGIAQNNYKNNTTMPFIAMLVSKLGEEACKKGDASCEERNSQKIKDVTSSIALYIAIFSELAKTALVMLAIGVLIPSNAKPVSLFTYLTSFVTFMFTSPLRFLKWRKELAEIAVKSKANAQGARTAELDHEQEKVNEFKKNEMLLLEADQWMKSITFDKIKLAVNVNKMMRNKKVKTEDALMLLILTCREFEENKQIPIHATIKSIIHKTENDAEYIKSLKGNMDISDSELISVIKEVCKPNRLTSIVLPALVDAELVSIKNPRGSKSNQYYWESVANVEDTFKYAIKQKMKRDSVEM